MQHKFTKNNNKIRQAFSIYGGMDMEEVVEEIKK